MPTWVSAQMTLLPSAVSTARSGETDFFSKVLCCWPFLASKRYTPLLEEQTKVLPSGVYVNSRPPHPPHPVWNSTTCLFVLRSQTRTWSSFSASPGAPRTSAATYLPSGEMATLETTAFVVAPTLNEAVSRWPLTEDASANR